MSPITNLVNKTHNKLTNRPRISAIFAISENGVIGDNGKLAWKLKSELKYFYSIISSYPLIIGSTTFKTLPLKRFENNQLIVIGKSKLDLPDNAMQFSSFDNAIEYLSEYNHTNAFVIGGAKLIESVIDLIDTLFITIVHAEVGGDCVLNIDDYISKHFHLTTGQYHKKSVSDDFDFTTEIYDRIPITFNIKYTIKRPPEYITVHIPMNNLIN